MLRQRSGRYQAVYKVDGERFIAPVTFFTKGDANAWLSLRQAEIVEHRWKPTPPPEPDPSFESYSTGWLTKRELSPKSLAEYRRMLHGRLAAFNAVTLDELSADLEGEGVPGWGPARPPTDRVAAVPLLTAKIRP